MDLAFAKYQGAGNDFVLLDNRQQNIALTTTQIAFLCDRKFGIGADGLMLLENDNTSDFRMIYFNADGNQSTMCGNGGRCIAAFAYSLGIVGKEMTFTAIDGLHKATINPDNTVSLHMSDVNEVLVQEQFTYLNTGSPHVVQWVDSIEDYDVVAKGSAIRNHSAFAPGGTNVNFITKTDSGICIRTYERGVEDETLACGTGVTAAAIVSVEEVNGNFSIPVKAMGGNLSVSFEKIDGNTYRNIILTGGAQFVFSGKIQLR